MKILFKILFPCRRGQERNKEVGKCNSGSTTQGTYKEDGEEKSKREQSKIKMQSKGQNQGQKYQECPSHNEQSSGT